MNELIVNNEKSDVTNINPEIEGTEKKSVSESELKEANLELEQTKENIVSELKEVHPELQTLTPETIRPRIEFVKTGIPGFDDLIAKGIPLGSQILISGGPGTLKTTFCLQSLVNSAKQGKKCLYLSFEEAKANIVRNMKTFGWDPDALLKSGNLVIKKMDPFQMSRSVETLLAQARGELLIEVDEVKNLIPDDMKPDLVAVDSLSAISAGFFGKEEGYRAYMSQIFETFRKMKTTAFLITEIEHSTTRYSKSGVEEFLSDAVFVFYNFRQGNQRLNATEIIKLRGTQHKKRIVPFKVIPDQGLIVYPTEELFVN